MSKIAWLVTHDTVIDRRIFFFADVFRKLGYLVRLFGGFPEGLPPSDDPDYVVRPIEKDLVKSYTVPISALPKGLHAVIQAELAAQFDWLEKKGFFKKKDNSVFVDLIGQVTIRTRMQDGLLFVFLTVPTGEVYAYNSLTDTYSISFSKYPLYEYETVALRAEELGKFKNKNFEGIFTSNNESCYSRVRKIPSRHYYEVDFSKQEMFVCREAEGPQIDEIDEIANHSFDYREYKKHVYSYGPILKTVATYLEEEQPDIVYVADLPTLPIGHILQESVGAKLIVDCHEWWYKQQRLWAPDATHQIKLSEEYEATLYPKCDLCITVGDYLAEDMSAIYGKPFGTIYSCLSQDLVSKPEDVDALFWANKFNISKSAKIALFQGSLTTLRNLETLAAATKYLENEQYLVVVGDGSFMPTFKKIVRTQGNEDRVLFAGWVPQAELMEYTVNAHLGVLPYRVVDEYFSYSVPNKLMEFFDAGLPILFDTSMREIQKVAGGCQVGCGIDMSAPEPFGLAMRNLLNSPEELRRLQDNYCAHKEMFSHRHQELLFINLLKTNGIIN